MVKSELVASRPMLPEDKNFIMATLLRGLYYGGSVFSEMKKQRFMESYQPIAEALLTKNINSTLVACLKEDPNVILGYVILNEDKNTIHYAFCKKPWRGIGVIRDLVPNTVRNVSHLTKTGLSILKRKGWDFDPFLL